MINNLSTVPYEQISNVNPVAETMSNDKALITRMLAHKHMVETIERFKWEGLPSCIPNDLIERILYYRFKGALFYYEPLDRYYFLPFTLYDKDNGNIDSYGRYIGITPVLFTGQWKSAGDGQKAKDIQFMSDTSYKVVYDLDQADDELDLIESMDYKGKAVILNDSSLEVAQFFTPMEYLIKPLIEQLTDILVLVNIDLVTSAKVFYVVAKDESQKDAIEQEFQNLDTKILNGKRVIVVTSPTDLKELTGTSAKDTARYFQSYQSVDNLRKDIIGLSNGGTFMKQEHTTMAETQTNSNTGSYVLKNALRQREEFCKIANKVFGLNISVSLSDAEPDEVIEPEGEQTKDHRGDNEGDE